MTDLTAAPWLRRGVLLERLTAVTAAGGVAVVAAECGCGKTVLLRQWMDDQRGGRAVAHVEVGAPNGWHAALDALARGGGGTVVVDRAERLDDAQRAALAAAALRRAPGTALIVAGRSDPGLDVDELGARGPVLELAGEDLAWSGPEVISALRRWGRAMADEDAEDVVWLTEGWCAAVRLAALAGPRVLRGETASMRRHLLGEALSGVPDELRTAAVRLSVADEFDAAVVEAVIEPPEGGERLLAALRRHRVFLRPAHEPGRWRFHRLFAQAARRELAAGSPAVAVDLHRRLVGHAAHAGDGAPASPADALGGLLHDELLAAHAVELLMEGRLAPPPPDTLAALGGAPAVGRLAVALAELTVGDVETADLALDGVGPAGEPVLEDLWSVAALLRARHAGDLAGADAAAHRVAASDAGGGRSALAWVELGTLEYDAGRYAEAEEHLHLAASLAERASRPALTARAWAGLAQLAASAGRLREATRIAALVEDRPDLPPDAGVRAEIARTIVAFLRDDLAQAGFHVGRARCAAGASQDPVLWLTVLLWEVAVLEGQGEDDRAGDRLAEAFDLLARCPGRPRHGLALDLFRIRLLERAGRSDEAAQRLAALAQQPHPALDLLIARRRLRDDDPDGAIAALRARLDETGGPARPLGIWRLLSYAAAVDRLGDHEAAHAAIEQALALAEPDAMRRPFTDDGPRARPLLERHLQRPTQHGAFVAELLDRLADGRPAPEAPFAVPLTDRERIVLGHLPSAMTAAEIAAALSVSEATVRTHLRHIYEKLGVHGRRDAVRRARDVRLLAPPGA